MQLGLLGLLLLAMVQITFGQGRTVTGKVVNGKDGSPVANATVLVKGTNRGYNTDAQGTFSLDAASSDVLVVSSVGFRTQELSLAGLASSFTVTLEETAGNLNEVVTVPRESGT
jgi:iron complex outermembrane receptor protein